MSPCLSVWYVYPYTLGVEESQLDGACSTHEVLLEHLPGEAVLELAYVSVSGSKEMALVFGVVMSRLDPTAPVCE